MPLVNDAKEIYENYKKLQREIDAYKQDADTEAAQILENLSRQLEQIENIKNFLLFVDYLNKEATSKDIELNQDAWESQWKGKFLSISNSIKEVATKFENIEYSAQETYTPKAAIFRDKTPKTKEVKPQEKQRFPLQQAQRLKTYTELQEAITKILKGASFEAAYKRTRRKNNMLSFLFKKRSSRKEIIQLVGQKLDAFQKKPSPESLFALKKELVEAKEKMNSEQSKRKYSKKSAMVDLVEQIDKAIKDYENPAIKDNPSFSI